ncbi:MAG TPA: hypothetical protein VFU43_02295 [Streptosporangiaceae bacterium]|nr:hypothetical protein [Streptosporangiaceae bacterium]
MWGIEESDDCGVHWRRADLTHCYFHPRIALLDALAIVKDEWRPPEHSLRELTCALKDESVAFYWRLGIRVVRVDRVSSKPALP